MWCKADARPKTKREIYNDVYDVVGTNKIGKAEVCAYSTEQKRKEEKMVAVEQVDRKRYTLWQKCDVQRIGSTKAQRVRTKWKKNKMKTNNNSGKEDNNLHTQKVDGKDNCWGESW